MDEAQEKPFGTVHYVVMLMLTIPDALLKAVADLTFAVPIVGQVIVAASEIYSLAVWLIIAFWFTMKLGFSGAGGMRVVVGGVLDLLGIPGSLIVGSLLAMRFANHPKEMAIAGAVTAKPSAGAEGAAAKEAAAAGKVEGEAAGAAKAEKAAPGTKPSERPTEGGAVTMEEVSPPPIEIETRPQAAPAEEEAAARKAPPAPEAKPSEAQITTPEAKPSEIPAAETAEAEKQKELAEALGERKEPMEATKEKLLEKMPGPEKKYPQKTAEEGDEREDYEEAA